MDLKTIFIISNLPDTVWNIDHFGYSPDLEQYQVGHIKKHDQIKNLLI